MKPPSIQSEFDRDGYAVARQLLATDEVALIRDTFMDLARDGPVPGISEMKHSGAGAYATSDPLAKYPRMMHPHQHPEFPVGELARCKACFISNHRERAGRIFIRIISTSA
jgi:hypothetical protein